VHLRRELGRRRRRLLGDVGLSEQQRATKRAELVEFFTGQPDPVGEALREMLTRLPWRDGGQLAFYLMTPTTSVLVSGSAGYWSGVFTGLRPDVAVLAAGGRPNLDGEPVQARSRSSSWTRCAHCSRKQSRPAIMTRCCLAMTTSTRPRSGPHWPHCPGVTAFDMSYAHPIPLSPLSALGPDLAPVL